LSLKSTHSPDWSEYYECEPNSFIGTQEQNNLVIGEVWTEFVDTNTLISRLWFVFENYKFLIIFLFLGPRTIAMAEKLWSSRELDNSFEAIDRFDRQQCLMQLRGIRVSLNVITLFEYSFE
jgi:hexosaminidase